MIISHEHKFIYIRSQKTASTTLDVFFSAYCDNNDVVTYMPESTPDWHKPCNYGWLNNNHVPANIVKKFAGDDIFNDYYKFTSIRNPIDKMLSCYFWWKQEPRLGPSVRPLDYSFSDWIMNYGFEHKMAIFHEPYYKIDGQIITDDYIRYERLIDDVMRICDIVGIKYNDKYMLHYKKVSRDYTDITADAINKINDKFNQEIIDLGYAHKLQT